MDLTNRKIFKLKGKVQPYAWGGHEFIPKLLGQQPGQQPAAEYWLGAHDLAPAEVLDNGQTITLNRLIAEHPAETIGKSVHKVFGRLPYLLKILDVKDMLSIQVHPSKLAAEQEYARENQEGIAPDDPKRNYKDDNHKPELMLALNDFWLLHGFKSKDQLREVLRNVPEFIHLVAVFEQSGYEGLYAYIMQMPQEEVNRTLQPLLDRIIPLYEEGRLNRSQEDFWAARAALTYNSNDNIDRGIFSIYLLNLVGLKKGEAVFQEAGILHAYLEGQNVEIMANSDNVLRGGLTPKNVDIGELMKHVRFEPVDPWIIQGTVENEERVYKTPVDDFQLSAFNLPEGGVGEFEPGTADIIIVLSGKVELQNGEEQIALNAGESAVAFPGQSIQLRAAAPSEVCRATVPVHSA
ncbi:MAG TPA: mannose-6-phosphate isomerase, class I [Chitinophagaceae bacterium]|nr:mannose-6-phosphate isomerase, class I [Chitinophagaceae bacterium]